MCCFGLSFGCFTSICCAVFSSVIFNLFVDLSGRWSPKNWGLSGLLMNFNLFFDDLKTGFSSIPRIFLICLFDSASKYRRTFLGPFWPILAILSGIFCNSNIMGHDFQIV